MSRPRKVICEVTAEGYSVTVLDVDDKTIFRTESKMESRGRATGDKSNVFDCEALSDYGHLASEVDDIASDLFGVACELYTIEEIEAD